MNLKVEFTRVTMQHIMSPSVTIEQHVFAFSFIIEGTTEKVLQFMMPLKSIYNRNFGFIEQIMYF